MISSPHRATETPRRRGRIALAALAVAVGCGLGGCGGSSSSSSSSAAKAASASAAATSSASSTATTSSPGAAKGSSSRSSKSATRHPRASATTTTTSTAASTAGSHRSRAVPPNLAKPHGQNPCTFVTAAQARAILGAPILKETEAPLGPTCILELRGRSQPVTVAVESITIAKAARGMRHPQRVTVAGHVAYCGVLGQPMLDVSLSAAKILNVTAPCTQAEALAAKALPHVAT